MGARKHRCPERQIEKICKQAWISDDQSDSVGKGQGQGQRVVVVGKWLGMEERTYGSDLAEKSPQTAAATMRQIGRSESFSKGNMRKHTEIGRHRGHFGMWSLSWLSEF